MKNELISIIMPAYNSELFIANAIDSIRAQTFRNWELVVVDDGSTDKTSDIVRAYCKEDDRIRYYYQENSKQAVARNYAIQKSTGYILAFLDADDAWLPKKLEVSMSLFDTKHYDLFFTNCYYSDNHALSSDYSPDQIFSVTDGVYAGNDSLKKFIEMNQIPILTVLVKKDKVITSGGFDPLMVPAEDFDLWIRLLKNGAKFMSISNCLSIYRIQDLSSTANDRLATKAVVRSLIKNFSSEDLRSFGVDCYLKLWIKRWIKFSYKSEEDNKELTEILQHFKVIGIKYKLLYLAVRYLPSKSFNFLLNLLA